MKIPVNEGTLSIYIREIQKYPVLSEMEERKLARSIRNGDEKAREMLINSNLRFVVNIAKSYQEMGTPLSDLINEGNVGLIKAVERFDERKGIRFLSYAVWWIRQAILKTVTEHVKSYRIPMSRAGHIIKISKAESRISQRKGRDPTVEELAKELHLKAKDVIEAMNIAKKDISLDAQIKDYDNLNYLDVIKSKITPSPEEIYFRNKFIEEVMKGLNKLDERERFILKKYFGLHNIRPHTLEEIGQQMGLSRERVRQLRNRAIAKLKKITYAS